MAYKATFTLKHREEVLHVDLNPRLASVSVTVMLEGRRLGVGIVTIDQLEDVETVMSEWRAAAERIWAREEQAWVGGDLE